jgi:hypothetical protein
MAEGEITLFQEGTEISIIGNCLLLKFGSDDDAIVAYELIKSLSGKRICVEELDS